MTLINDLKGCHTSSSGLDDVMFVPAILSLAFPSRFLLEWLFYPAPDMGWQTSQWGTGLRAFGASPLEQELYKREVTV